MSAQITIVIRIDMHKYDSNAEDISDYDIQDTKKYNLKDFPPNDQKIVLSIVEKQMNDYVNFCIKDNEYEALNGTNYNDYCSDFGYVRSRVKIHNVTSKEIKIYLKFEDCIPKKITEHISKEITDGFFSSVIDSVLLSDGEYNLIPQLDSWGDNCSFKVTWR